MKTPVLIVMPDPETVLSAVRRLCTDETVVVAQTLEELEHHVATTRPEVAFSVRSDPFGPEAHRLLLDCPSLRWLHVGGSGVDHLYDEEGRAWDRSRLTVTNSAAVLAPFLADSCMGAILAFNQNLVAYAQAQRGRVWRPKSFRPIEDQNLLIVGVGAIGRVLARRAKAFRMHVIGLRRNHAEPMEDVDELYPPEALFEQLGRADIVSVHLRLTPSTTGIFNRYAFEAMKPGATFLNTARGGHVVEADLVEAVDSGQVGAAYLDVFAEEPLPPESPLWERENVLISPHSSDQVQDWDLRFAHLFIENLARWRAGQPLAKVVKP